MPFDQALRHQQRTPPLDKYFAPRVAGSNVLPSNQFLQTVQNSVTSKMLIIMFVSLFLILHLF